MRLTTMTDYALRLLMYVAQRPERLCTIAEVAQAHGISEAHLMKITHLLGLQGWIETVRGKGGGMRLAREPSAYQVGDLIRELEQQGPLIDCREPPCALDGACRLAGVLAQTLAAFYDALNAYTLADLVRDPTAAAIIKLHRAA